MTHFMVQATVPEEILRQITGGSLRENVDAFIRLSQRYVSDLRALRAEDEATVTRAIFIGQEALQVGEMVFRQIQQQTDETGQPPLSPEEFRRFQMAAERARPETMNTIIRTHPNVFERGGDAFLAFSEKKAGLVVADLCAAYIRAARKAKTLYQANPESASGKLYDFLGRSVLIVDALRDEIKTDVPAESRGGPKGAGVVMKIKSEIVFAKAALTFAYKTIQDSRLELAPGGLQVSVLHGDTAPMVFIRIPVRGEGSVARANSDMNAALAALMSKHEGVKIPDSVHVSFRRVG